MSKRTLDSFFAPPQKRPQTESAAVTVTDLQEHGSTSTSLPTTEHATYPWPVPHLPQHIADEIEQLVTAQGKVINDQAHLDLLYFEPFIPKSVERELFHFLRSNLFFYRVQYQISKFGKDTIINTPRFTTVFGLDETSRFIGTGASAKIVEAKDLSKPVSKERYKGCKPRPIPECLDFLRRVTEANSDTKYNICLVNYYADGNDSISFHSDDERFLGPDPAIASFTLGAKRDFLMKHKPVKAGEAGSDTTPLKFALSTGDMLLMRGKTQSNWLHSIPKRAGGDAGKGRINITLRRAMIPAGTENYYRYNVGSGGVYKWNDVQKKMVSWQPS